MYEYIVEDVSRYIYNSMFEVDLYPVGYPLQTSTLSFSDIQIYYAYPWPDVRFFRHTYPGSASTRVPGYPTTYRAVYGL